MKEQAKIRMNKERRIHRLHQVLSIISILLGIASSIADPSFDYQNEAGYENNDNIYSDPASYQNYDFYLHSDPAKWDITKIDWTAVDYRRSEIYSRSDFYTTPDFYRNLPTDGYKQLDYNLVDYTSTGLKQDQIDSSKFLADFKCTGCTFDKTEQPQANIKYEKGRITVQKISTGEGVQVDPSTFDTISLPSGFPASTKFKVINDRIVVSIPQGKEAFDASILNLDLQDKTNSFTLDTAITDPSLQGKDKTSESPPTITYNNNPITGKLSFKGGQPYVRNGDELTISGITITSEGYERGIDPEIQTQGVNLYFENTPKAKVDDDYIIIDKSNGKVTAHKGDVRRKDDESPETFEVTFDSKNPIFEMKGRDYLSMDIGTGTTVTLQKRKGLIPLVTATMPPKDNGGSFILHDGRNIASVKQKKDGGRYDLLTRADRTHNRATSVPLTLVAQNEKGSNLFPKHDQTGSYGVKLVYDNTNSGLILSTRTLPKDFECISCTRDLKKTALAFIQNHQDIAQTNPGKIPSFDENVVQIHQAMDQLPLALQAAVRDIKIFHNNPSDLAEFHKECGTDALACYSDGVSYVPETVLTDDKGTLEHEAAHAFQDAIEKAGGVAAKYKLGSFEQVWESATKDEKEESLYRKTPQNTKAAAKDEPQNTKEESKVEWPGCDSSLHFQLDCSGPRNGFVSAYGATNYYEDVATHTECGLIRSCWEPLITPETNTYDSRNVEKFHLLCNQGFFHDSTCEDMAEVNPQIRSMTK